MLSGISVGFWSRSGSFRGGAPYISPSGSLSLDTSSFWSCYCTRFLLYCIYWIRLLLYLIYTSYLKTGFPQGGFIQGHVTKNTCVYTCILAAVRSSYFCPYFSIKDRIGVLLLFGKYVCNFPNMKLLARAPKQR